MSKPSRGLIHSLFVEHAREIGTFIRRRISEDQDAEDILQEAFVRLSRYPQWDAVQNPRNFLYQTAANIAVDYYRRGKLRADYAEPDIEPDQTLDTRLSPHRHWESQQLLEQLDEWLLELPEPQRHAFILHSIEGHTYSDIAARLGLSPSTAERYAKAAMLHISMRMSEADAR